MLLGGRRTQQPTIDGWQRLMAMARRATARWDTTTTTMATGDDDDDDDGNGAAGNEVDDDGDDDYYGDKQR